MSLCLLTDPWLPVRRRSDNLDVIAPHDIAASGSDPVVALDWPRPDFRLAGLEFLIGLFATACPPRDHRVRMEGYRAPPDAGTLASAFAPLAHAFVLDGDGPRFMQEIEDFASGANPAAALLIEAPGENTAKRNTDLLVKRDQVNTLSRAAAAMALYTLQAYAPAGGAGNRTSLRGGGPLTTIAIPPRQPDEKESPLWHLLWSNVPCGEPLALDELPRVFPWLASTRVSDKGGRATTPADVHPLQAWWGMPRRVRLDFTANPDGAACNLTGTEDSVVVRSWRQRPWGVNYQVWGGVHPLSPCYRTKPGEELLYRHPQPGGIGYQHWLGLLSARQDPLRRVAPAIEEFRRLRAADIGRSPVPWRLLAAGYDMDNMKARGFAESEMPVHELSDPGKAAEYDGLLRAMVAAADVAGRLVAGSVRRALFSEGSSVGTDTAPISALRERFWAETADAFFACAADAARDAPDDETRDDEIRARWLDTLSRTARRLFHEAAPVDASGEGHPARVAEAARQLGAALAGYGKSGEALFTALGAALPERARKAKARKEKAA